MSWPCAWLHEWCAELRAAVDFLQGTGSGWRVPGAVPAQPGHSVPASDGEPGWAGSSFVFPAHGSSCAAFSAFILTSTRAASLAAETQVLSPCCRSWGAADPKFSYSDLAGAASSRCGRLTRVSEFSERSSLYLISSFLRAAVGMPVPNSVVIKHMPSNSNDKCSSDWPASELRTPARELDSCADNLVARTLGHF